MFSLIITLIAIALVVVLAIAGVYYGGSAYKQGQAAASAATFTLQSEQILGAAQLFRSREGVWPVDIAEMVSKSYLTSNMSVPSNALAQNDVPMSGLLLPVANAQAAPSTPQTVWSSVVASVPQFWVPSSVNEETCRIINLKARGDNGIYAQAVTSLPMQCYGSASPYTVLAQLAAPDVAQLAVTLPLSQTGAVVVATTQQATYSKQPDTTATPALPANPTPTNTGGPLDVSPSNAVSFSGTETGATSQASVVFSNYTGSPVSLTGTSVSGVGFDVVSSTCVSGTLAVNANCTVGIRFSPTAIQAYPGTLTVHGQTVTLDGLGIAPVPNTGGNLDNFSGDPLTFGSVIVGEAVQKVASFANFTGADVTFGAPTVTGEGFSLVATDCMSPFQAWNYCGVTIAFNATNVGAKTGTLSIHGQTVQLSATVALPGPGSFTAATVMAPIGPYGNTSAIPLPYFKMTGGPVTITSIQIADQVGSVPLAGQMRCGPSSAFGNPYWLTYYYGYDWNEFALPHTISNGTNCQFSAQGYNYDAPGAYTANLTATINYTDSTGAHSYQLPTAQAFTY